jgi:hypothetical protein
MIQVKQLHRVMPLEVRVLLNYLAEELKGEHFFSDLEPEDQWDVISTLCDNPSEWLAIYDKEDFEPEDLHRHHI